MAMALPDPSLCPQADPALRERVSPCPPGEHPGCHLHTETGCPRPTARHWLISSEISFAGGFSV